MAASRSAEVLPCRRVASTSSQASMTSSPMLLAKACRPVFSGWSTAYLAVRRPSATDAANIDSHFPGRRWLSDHPGVPSPAAAVTPAHGTPKTVFPFRAVPGSLQPHRLWYPCVWTTFWQRASGSFDHNGLVLHTLRKARP